jgi:ribA/ribD-fused uncharacterized protein
MEPIFSKKDKSTLEDFIKFIVDEPHAELECKVLQSKITIKPQVDRLIEVISGMSTGVVKESNYANFLYNTTSIRVVVEGVENIHKICLNNSFRDIPLTKERKRKCLDADYCKLKADTINIPEIGLKFTLRKEEQLGKDFSGKPLDDGCVIRIISRKSWTSIDGILQFDLSQVKTRQPSHKTFGEVLKQLPSYELEIEIINRKVSTARIIASLLRALPPILGAHQGSPFIIQNSDIERYKTEFQNMGLLFVNPVSMERRHAKAAYPNNVLSGYTVTVKADGDRSMLIVMRDKRLIRVNRSMSSITWTGLTALKDTMYGTIIDGEFIGSKNLYIIFDMYSYKGKDIRGLPLLTNDMDIVSNPLSSRLGCAKEFVETLSKNFSIESSPTPFRIETKLFLAGDGVAMEQAINKLLSTKYEFETDGLIFTPRGSFAPKNELTKTSTWTTLYKWKPPSQNSIDFLVQFEPKEIYDSVGDRQVFKGNLYVTKHVGKTYNYPCETLTGEYVQPELPASLKGLSDKNKVPAYFQPDIPKNPDAHEILIPVNKRGVPIDNENVRIENNTIIECVYDMSKKRWEVMRTRYDKTYQYRVLHEQQYGNVVETANSIWTNVHIPITEEMLKTISTKPITNNDEDDLYYRDSMARDSAILINVYNFHNIIKQDLFKQSLKRGDTLLELAMGRGGDMQKWKASKPSKVVGIELSESNLSGASQGACVRYLQQREREKLPPVLYITGDMTMPFEEYQSKYMKMILGTIPPTTTYLEQFVGLTEFNVISCQFAIHYACQDEAMFRSFAGNLSKHGKGMFIGTCLDARSVYALLLGKSNHIFRADSRVFGEFTKKYEDGSGYVDEFGQQMVVYLENFEKPIPEYLVPFDKITTILEEVGYELVNTTMFSEHYSHQNSHILTNDEQQFSFLHRSFIFKKSDKPIVKKEEEVAIELPMIEAEKPVTGEAPPKKKKLVRVVEQGEEPALFQGADESSGEFRMFSNMYDAPIQIDNQVYPTVEHYYQWSKAKMFKDDDTANKIMETKTVKAVKSLGKKVANFKTDEWDAKRDEIMRSAVKAKVLQHPEILAKLKETKNRPIGKADAREKYWGIGSSANLDKAKRPDKWAGQNKLGKIWMDLRTEFTKAE